MKVAYSLISCNGDYFSIGIYTSLRKCYAVLKNIVRDTLKEGYSKEEIKEWYEIRKVFLNAEPLICYEFSQCGEKIPISWEKIYKKSIDKKLIL